MQTKDNYPRVVTGRVTERAYNMMKEYGFTVRDAVEWFLIYKVDQKKRVELEKSLLKDEIYHLKLDLCAKEMQLEGLTDEE